MQIFHNANYNFIKWRWHALILSLVIIWAGVGTIFMKGGIPLGIEFTGGTAIQLKFDHRWPAIGSFKLNFLACRGSWICFQLPR